MGLGGAFSGYGEGNDGVASNAAAPAVREPYSVNWFEYDLSFSLSFPGSFSQTDFNNRGRRPDERTSRFDDFLYLNLGVLMQFGQLGVAVTSDLQRFDLAPGAAERPGLTLEVARWQALAAYGFADNQIVVGSGARIVTLQIREAASLIRTGSLIGSGTVLTMAGASPVAGILIKPNHASYRFGATVRAPVRGPSLGQGRVTVDGEGVRRAGDFVLPGDLVQPWELEMGVALQVGPRPLNPAWLNPHTLQAPVQDRIDADREARLRTHEAELAEASSERERRQLERRFAADERALRVVEDARLDAEKTRLLAQRRARYANWPRERLLLVASVLLTGPSQSAVALESFLDQEREPYAGSLSVSPRAGIESEPWVSRLIARAGSYVEPSRFESGSFRQHFTAGAEFRLTSFDFWGLIMPTMWKLNVAGDVAPRYSNWSVGIGVWH